MLVEVLVVIPVLVVHSLSLFWLHPDSVVFNFRLNNFGKDGSGNKNSFGFLQRLGCGECDERSQGGNGGEFHDCTV